MYRARQIAFLAITLAALTLIVAQGERGRATAMAAIERGAPQQ